MKTIEGEGDPMKKMTAAITAGLAAVTLGVVLVGCGSSTDTETSTSSSTSTSAAALIDRPETAGPNKTINDYIVENNIAETPFKPDDPGTPNFDFPFPPGWSNAGPRTPDWAYAAIVYDNPQDPNDPPGIIAIASKLTGNVDPAKILEYAPGDLENLTDFEPLNGPTKTTLGGFDAIQSSGTYMRDGEKRFVAQRTVVVPTEDGLYALQMSADTLDGQEGVVIEAADLIEEQTKITP